MIAYMHGIIISCTTKGCQASEERDGLWRVYEREIEMLAGEFGDDGETAVVVLIYIMHRHRRWLTSKNRRDRSDPLSGLKYQGRRLANVRWMG